MKISKILLHAMVVALATAPSVLVKSKNSKNLKKLLQKNPNQIRNLAPPVEWDKIGLASLNSFHCLL
jgi:hypothetical protein